MLCTVYAAVHRLCANSIMHPIVDDPLPFKDDGFKALVQGRQPFRTPNGLEVVRIFDTTDTCLSPNVPDANLWN